MKIMKSFFLTALAVAILNGVWPAAPAAGQPIPQDVVTVGTVNGAGSVDVPVYIRDVSRPPLRIDQPFGSRIQAYCIPITASPARAVQSMTPHPACLTQ